MGHEKHEKHKKWLGVWGAVVLAAGAGQAEIGRWVAGMEEGPRPLWNNSRVVGSPDPPLPYRTEPAYTNIPWNRPLYLEAEPGTDQLLVVLQGGETDRPSRIVRLRDDPDAGHVDPLLEMEGRLIYGLTFHPGYLTNGHLYVFSNGPTGASDRTNRISRFTVSRAPPQACDPASERIIIEWPSSGHDGGDLVFGRDDMLYIASGDGTSDSDGWVTGQDLTDLAGAVLRIDVDGADAGGGDPPYVVPPDNPFLQITNARPELWAYGLRNPWRITVDRETGHLWVGNNGQDLWETAHLVRRGDNLGWSVYEGSHPFYLNRPRGPTPVVAPTIEHSHSEFRSLTGGVVYYGDRLPPLNGVYVYGDYSTGKIWGGRHDGQRLVWHRELADTLLQIVGFGLSHQGELLILDLGGSIHRLVPAPPQTDQPPFPVRLSETGLFQDTAAHQTHPALAPYSVNAPGWADGAEAERWIALPGTDRIRYGGGDWQFPEGTVLMQTFSFPAGPRLETRLLTLQQGQWVGYSYRWSTDQSDAALVEAAGADIDLQAPNPRDPSGPGQPLRWRFPSRTECLTCHSRAANFVLGVTTPQMNRDHDYGNVRTNQLRALARLGVFENPPGDSPENGPRMADPYDASLDLEERARAYLHVNCSVCHVEAGGGNAQMDLRRGMPPEKARFIGTRPQHDTFGIPNAMIVAPGDPERSVLLHRLARRGPGQMPPLVSSRVDEDAVRLLRAWILSLPSSQVIHREWTMDQLEPALKELASDRSPEAGRAAFEQTGCVQCHRFRNQGGSVGPDLTGIGKRLSPREMLESILLPSQVIAPEYATTEIELASGEVQVGRIEGETPDAIRLRPVGSLEDPLVLPKSQVRSRRLSGVSNMPSGLLDTLTREQVLDLLAYLREQTPASGPGNSP